MDVKAYLQRINYEGNLEPSAETLRNLQLAHLHEVPFENLSVHNGEKIVLTDEALFDKIVRRRRGGFCYELNGLFAALLRALGFAVTMLSARVADAQGEFGPDFDHMALLVRLDERWLVDVGFGDSFRNPLLLDDRNEQPDGQRSYWIRPEGECFSLRQRDFEGDIRKLYRFNLKSYQYADYAEMCAYHQTSPDSHFTQKRICSRATLVGRITVADNRLITTAFDGQREEQELVDEAEFNRVLKQHFGITLDANF